MQTEFVKINEKLTLHVYPANETELEVVVQSQGRLPAMDVVAEFMNEMVRLASEFVGPDAGPESVRKRFDESLQDANLVQAAWAWVTKNA